MIPLVLQVLCLVLHVLCPVLYVLCLVLHVLYPHPSVFYPHLFLPLLFFNPHLFLTHLFLTHHFFNTTFLPALLWSWSSVKFSDWSESRKPKAESWKPKAKSREPRADLIWDLFDFPWDVVILPIRCRSIPALRGPRREPACIDGWWWWWWWMDGHAEVKKNMIFGNFSKTIRYFFLVVSRPLRRVLKTFSEKNSKKIKNF